MSNSGNIALSGNYITITDTTANYVSKAYVDGMEELETDINLIKVELEQLKNDMAESLLLGNFVAVSASRFSVQDYLEGVHKL